jgi:hypothetical protein
MLDYTADHGVRLILLIAKGTESVVGIIIIVVGFCGGERIVRGRCTAAAVSSSIGTIVHGGGACRQAPAGGCG